MTTSPASTNGSSNSATTPPTTPDSVTGNLVFVALVAVLAATVLIPMLRGELPKETLSNIAIGSMGVVGTLAAGAAGWHFRGKFTLPQNDPPTDTQATSQANTQTGNITVNPPAPTAQAPSATPPRVNTPSALLPPSGAAVPGVSVPNESNPTGRPS